MANITHGMDIQAVRQLAKLLDQKANELLQIGKQVDGKLKSVAWKGKDRDNFVNEWDSVIMRNLRDAANKMQDAGRSASRNADQQESTSNS